MRRARTAIAILLALGAGACAPPASTYEWELPPGFPTPVVPDDNPMSDEKVELGRYLFFDRRLSGNQTQSCGDCHEQSRAFTDGRAVSTGSTGDMTPRSSMSLVNVAYNATYTWANPGLVHLEEQALVPMFGEAPVELGLAGREDELVQRLRDEPLYPPMFAAAFPADADPITITNIVRAIASFQRTIISAGSPWDRYQRGDASAVSESAIRGRELFDSERFECFHCHGGFNFTDSATHTGQPLPDGQFHNDALYNIDGRGAYPEPNRGLYEHDRDLRHMGFFRAPTLRNIELTAPYMHDGSIATLDEVLDHYAAGGRTIESGPNAGVGAESPLKSIFLHGFEATPQEREDLLTFLRSLTDPGLATDPRFANPWP